jgi:hypothetical protein
MDIIGSSPPPSERSRRTDTFSLNPVQPVGRHCVKNRADGLGPVQITGVGRGRWHGAPADQLGAGQIFWNVPARFGDRVRASPARHVAPGSRNCSHCPSTGPATWQSHGRSSLWSASASRHLVYGASAIVSLACRSPPFLERDLWSERRSDLLTIVWNPCPRSRGMRAQHQLECADKENVDPDKPARKKGQACVEQDDGYHGQAAQTVDFRAIRQRHGSCFQRRGRVKQKAGAAPRA